MHGSSSRVVARYIFGTSCQPKFALTSRRRAYPDPNYVFHQGEFYNRVTGHPVVSIHGLEQHGAFTHPELIIAGHIFADTSLIVLQLARRARASCREILQCPNSSTLARPRGTPAFQSTVNMASTKWIQQDEFPPHPSVKTVLRPHDKSYQTNTTFLQGIQRKTTPLLGVPHQSQPTTKILPFFSPERGKSHPSAKFHKLRQSHECKWLLLCNLHFWKSQEVTRLVQTLLEAAAISEGS